MYLRRNVEWLFNLQNMANAGYEFSDVFIYCPNEDTFTVNLLGETTVYRVLAAPFTAHGAEAFSAFFAPHSDDVSLPALNERPAMRNVTITYFAEFTTTPNTQPDMVKRIRRYIGQPDNEFVFASAFDFEGTHYNHSPVDSFTQRYGFEPHPQPVIRSRPMANGVSAVYITHGYTRRRGFNEWTVRTREIVNNRVFIRTQRIITYSTNPAVERVTVDFGNVSPLAGDFLETLPAIVERAEPGLVAMINAGFFCMRSFSQDGTPQTCGRCDKSIGWTFDGENLYDAVRYAGQARFLCMPRNNNSPIFHRFNDGVVNQGWHQFRTLFYYNDNNSGRFSEVLTTGELQSRARERGLTERELVEEMSGNAAFIIGGFMFPGSGRAQRSMIGVREDGSVILMSAYGIAERDGLTVPYRNNGLTIAEGIAILHSMGAVDVINLDGGGSVQFYYADYGSNGMVTPGFDGVSYRRVGSVIQVYGR